MTKPIVFAVANQKGGVGKSTLTGHLAVRATTENSGPVTLIDTDEQGSLAAWWNTRAAEQPIFVTLPDLPVLPRAIEAVGQNGGKYLFIDTPPQATQAIAFVVEQADFIIIPIRPSPHDLRAVGRTLEIVNAARKPFLFVITQAKQNALLTVQTMAALSVHGVVSPAVIHDRVDYAASMTGGLTVLETDPRGRSAAEIIELWDFVKERLNASTQERNIPLTHISRGAA
jgi:chromosome partitioning protein